MAPLLYVVKGIMSERFGLQAIPAEETEGPGPGPGPAATK